MNVVWEQIKDCSEHNFGEWISNNKTKPIKFRVCKNCTKIEIEKMKDLNDVIKTSSIVRKK